MKHVEFWVSDDGTHFASEDECENYEMWPSHDVLEGMRLLGSEFSEVIVEGDRKDISWEMAAYHIRYIRLDSTVSINWLQKLGDYTGLEFPNKRGTFYWDGEQWCCIEDQLEELARIRRKLTE